MSELKIQSGRYYRTRDGRKVGPMTDRGKRWNWKCPLGRLWMDNGRYEDWGLSDLDLIAEWTDTPDHIILSTNGRTYDLTALETPFGLLPEDVQKAIMRWPYVVSVWDADVDWIELAALPKDTLRGFKSGWVYRAKPAPQPKEWVLYWQPGKPASLDKVHSDTRRLTIRYTGDTLPAGAYTGPDGAAIIVEALK